MDEGEIPGQWHRTDLQPDPRRQIPEMNEWPNCTDTKQQIDRGRKDNPQWHITDKTPNIQRKSSESFKRKTKLLYRKTHQTKS